MIAHVVLFKPNDTLSPTERLAILDTVGAALQRCPTVRGVRVGRRVRHGVPGYEQAMTDDYQYALILEFEDVQGLREYLTNPAHAQLGSFFTSAASKALAYDYELLTIDELKSDS